MTQHEHKPNIITPSKQIYRNVEIIANTSEPFAVLPLFNFMQHEASHNNFGDINNIDCEINLHVGGFFDNEQHYKHSKNALEHELRRSWSFNGLRELPSKD